MKLLHLALVLFSSTCLAESNWPQFRGDGGLGIGTGKPPLEFGGGRNVKWKTEVPHGHSSPCTTDKHLFAFDDRAAALLRNRIE